MTENVRHMTAFIRHSKSKGFIMIEVLLGSKNAERVLIYIFAREEGYPREIARFFNTDLKSIQNQMDKLEAGGVLVSREVGRTRPYSFNPRYSFLNELKALLEKAFSFYPAKEQEELTMNRRRPRAKGKDL
jgi:DNA-binding MarR family transcriptional regulator